MSRLDGFSRQQLNLLAVVAGFKTVGQLPNTPFGYTTVYNSLVAGDLIVEAIVDGEPRYLTTKEGYDLAKEFMQSLMVNEPLKEEMPTEIRLGLILRDRITGFQGTCTAKVDILGGNVMWTLQPRAKLPTKIDDIDSPVIVADAKSIDEHTLEIIGDSGLKPLAYDPEAMSISLGEEVKDSFTGNTGHVNERITFFNGCVYYNFIVNNRTVTNEVESKMFLPYQRLEKTGKSLARIVPKSEKAKGGPMRAGPAVR